MNKLFFCLLILSLVITQFLCDDNSVKADPDSNSEFFITPGMNEDIGWFEVKNIVDDETTGVDAVQQLNGRLYLPMHSSVPGFNNQMVNGYFVNDTNYYNELTGDIFVVTKHIRDTSLGFYGEYKNGE